MDIKIIEQRIFACITTEKIMNFQSKQELNSESLHPHKLI